MKVAFISNFYNHHQAPFSEAMNELTHGNYRFIATAAMDDDSLPLGMDPLTRADAARTLYQISRLRRNNSIFGFFR
jgi:hypothetical protein